MNFNTKQTEEAFPLEFMHCQKSDNTLRFAVYPGGIPQDPWELLGEGGALFQILRLHCSAFLSSLSSLEAYINKVEVSEPSAEKRDR